MPNVQDFLSELQNRTDDVPKNTGWLFYLQNNYEAFRMMYRENIAREGDIRLMLPVAWAYDECRQAQDKVPILDAPDFPREIIQNMVHLEPSELVFFPDYVVARAYEHSEAIRFTFGNHEALSTILFCQFSEDEQNYYLYYGQRDFQSTEQAIRFHRKRYFNGYIG
ncbi:hypothetical protein PQX77_022234 [Marasmius sp. AFHP31]|nr:hypothetical protein PQX77_022234 [Marasmius sp. AFHP31]